MVRFDEASWKVWGRDPTSGFASGYSVVQHHLLTVSLFPTEMPWLPCGRSADRKGEGLSLDSPSQPIDLCFHPYVCTLVSSAVTLQWVLKSGRADLPALSFFFKIVLNIPSALHFCMNFSISFSMSAKKPAGIWQRPCQIRRSTWVLPSSWR